MEQTQFDKDLEVIMAINDGYQTRAWYNLVISIRDVSLWTKGIAPHRHWRLKHVKEYFGVKGNAKKILEQLKYKKELYDQMLTKLTQ